MKNLTTADKAALITKLRSLPGLTDEEKANLIGLLDHQKKYGLVWEDKTEEAEERLRDCLPVLREVKERAIVSEDSDAPNHILIEGDNLEALTALSYTHEGKVDVIYIDPPYNTGNKDFVYNDKFVDSEDDYRHSKWLSFMHKRLKIARRLLSERGVIFISIDDNEQANLKLLCDEVFGEKNFVAKFDWRRKTGANDAKDIAVITESVLCYAKNKLCPDYHSIWKRDKLSRNEERFRFQDEYVNERGRYYLDTLDRGGLRYSDSLNYGITAPDGGIIFPHGRDFFLNDGWIWKWSKEKVEWGLANGFLEFVESKKSKGSKYTIKYKVYEFVDNEGNIKENIGRAYSNLILDNINQQGNIEMSNIFDGDVPFSNPKPLGLIQYLLQTLDHKIVLDFFAGSGTTLHAMMKMNEDGGKRQCILVTNNENNICEEVTYERNKRVIRGYTTPKGEEVEGLTANTLRYYKTDLISRDRTPRNMRALMDAATDLLCIKEDAYSERKMLGEMQLEPKRVRMFDSKNGQMLVIYDEQCAAEIAHALQSCSVGDRKIKTYIFSPGRYAFDDEFAYVQDKVELVALPAAIYDAYQRVLPKRKDKQLSYNEEGGEK